MPRVARKPVEPTNEHPELEQDPVWQAFLSAPVAPPDTDEERELIEAARQRAEWIPGAVVSAEIAERCRREG